MISKPNGSWEINESDFAFGNRPVQRKVIDRKYIALAIIALVVVFVIIGLLALFF